MKNFTKHSKTRRSFGFKSGLMTVITLVWAMNLQAQDVQWKKNFGGAAGNDYKAVATLPDGIVAVGCSDSFGNGDWAGVAGKGAHDATIVKYDNMGNVVWKKNFGGKLYDSYFGVTVVSDGIVAVGRSDSFGDGDWTSVQGKGDKDAIIVKYDHSGNVVWKKNFGGGGWDEFKSVTTVPDGVVAVGISQAASFNSAGDWAGYSSNVGFSDAIIVKYDNNGNVVWKKHFGGIGDGGSYNSGMDCYNAITTVSDGIVAVGVSKGDSFGSGDWFGIIGKGNDDAIIVKYDNNGTVMWKKNFGGIGDEEYKAVTTVADSIVAVGISDQNSFGTGDWTGISKNGTAIIVKYAPGGNVVWKKSFGGGNVDEYKSVTPVFDGILATGFAQGLSFGNGDWTGVSGKGNSDAIIVKYGNNGNVVWKKNFGGSDADLYYAVVAVPDGVAAVGYSLSGSFGNGDWTGVAGKGIIDAIIVKYTIGTMGGSSISGYVKESGGGKSITSKNTGIPVEGVDVLLQKYTNDWSTLAATVSNENGYFEFLNLIAGKYRVILDIPDLEMLNTIDIELDGENSFNSLEFLITEEGIITIDNSVSVADIYKDGNKILLYPNPTTGELRIMNYELRINSVEIYDIYGRNVGAKFPSNSLEGWQPQADGVVLNISHLPSGIYFVKIQTETEFEIQKIVKQ